MLLPTLSHLPSPRYDTALAALAVPPLPSNLPQALKGKGKSKDGEIDLGKVLDEKTLRDQLVRRSPSPPRARCRAAA